MLCQRNTIDVMKVNARRDILQCVYIISFIKHMIDISLLIKTVTNYVVISTFYTYMIDIFWKASSAITDSKSVVQICSKMTGVEYIMKY